MKPNSFHARVLTNRYLPKVFKYGILILVNWFFHGFLYMDWTEKTFFLFLDGIFFLPVFLSLLAVSNLSLSVAIAIVAAHTLHWFFNGHLYVLFKNLGHSKTEFDHLKDYMKELSERAKGEKSILAIAVFGSLSRHQLTESSDLDVRIIRQRGAINGLKACMFTFMERSRALLGKIPLDVYTCDGFRSLSKIDTDELPVILYDPQKRLEEYYKRRGQSGPC